MNLFMEQDVSVLVSALLSLSLSIDVGSYCGCFLINLSMEVFPLSRILHPFLSTISMFISTDILHIYHHHYHYIPLQTKLLMILCVLTP